MPDHRTPRSALLALALAAMWLGAPQVVQAQRRCRVADVAVLPTDLTMPANTSAPFSATAYDNTGGTCDNVLFSWASSNSGIATVDANGTVTAIAAGVTQIVARTGSGPTLKVGRATVTVTAAAASNAASAAT